jgi:hypothetical protein
MPGCTSVADAPQVYNCTGSIACGLNVDLYGSLIKVSHSRLNQLHALYSSKRGLLEIFSARRHGRRCSDSSILSFPDVSCRI